MNTSRPSGRRRRAAGLLGAVSLAAGLGLTACDDASDDDSGEPAIHVTDAWARSSPTAATAGAAYLMVTNTGSEDDALISAAVGDDVAAQVELHETRAVATDETMGGTATTMGDSGAEPSTSMMEMAPVDRIEVPAGATAMLEPGGYHIMLLDLVEPLEEGDELELTLTFENAGEISVTAVAGEGPP
jgi:hypothetical protein